MSSKSELAVGFLGPKIEHLESLGSMLAGRVARCEWLVDSISFRRSRENTDRSGALRAYEAFFGTRDAAYLDEILARIDTARINTLIGYWGTLPLQDLIAIKKARPQLKIFLMLLCFPLSINTLGVRKQQMHLNAVAQYLDGFIYPSKVMEQYFLQHLGRSKKMSSLVLPPAWPQAYSLKAPATPFAEAPNLIFLGRTDLSSKTIHPADDLRVLMSKILDTGIYLHHAHSDETMDQHPFRRTFSPRNVQELIAFANSADASLIAYNLEACKDRSRFRNTVPDRVISSIAAALPVALPTIGYDAVKEHLAEYDALIEFSSLGALKEMLSDRSHVANLKARAFSNRTKYFAEHVGKRLSEFLQGAV